MRIKLILATLAFTISGCTSAENNVPVLAAAPIVEDRISVEVQGDGPDVILVPGLASSTAVWSGLTEELRGRHRIHLVQLAGFAGAPAPANLNRSVAAQAAEAIADYIAREKLQSPTVIGHSLGGEVGLMIAARREGLIGGLIVVDALPFYSLLFNPDATVVSVTPQAEAFREAILSAPEAQAEAIQTAAIARLVKTAALRAELVEASLASDRETFANATYELMTTDLREELDRITIPVEVIYAYDPAYGVPAGQIDKTFRDAYAAASTATFKRIDNSFHFIMLDQPELFTETVETFLNQEE